MLSRDEKYGGREPSKRWSARVANLYSILNLTDSQWSSYIMFGTLRPSQELYTERNSVQVWYTQRESNMRNLPPPPQKLHIYQVVQILHYPMFYFMTIKCRQFIETYVSRISNRRCRSARDRNMSKTKSLDARWAAHSACWESHFLSSKTFCPCSAISMLWSSAGYILNHTCYHPLYLPSVLSWLRLFTFL